MLESCLDIDVPLQDIKILKYGILYPSLVLFSKVWNISSYYFWMNGRSKKTFIWLVRNLKVQDSWSRHLTFFLSFIILSSRLLHAFNSKHASTRRQSWNYTKLLQRWAESYFSVVKRSLCTRGHFIQALIHTKLLQPRTFHLSSNELFAIEIVYKASCNSRPTLFKKTSTAVSSNGLYTTDKVECWSRCGQ